MNQIDLIEFFWSQQKLATLKAKPLKVDGLQITVYSQQLGTPNRDLSSVFEHEFSGEN
ncbi:hypothetical protein PL9214290999 [Planktothrix tepida PCC 9214]|uniref:Uncharacterized protein n=1 Tax=Planktothrix tepida PCC 9214 TaxID=671072 RepID=A0A1J1LG16_9CYAN|nr:hypothetical protein PL9214290999 [Planktothrix tepida PCC 9214]